MFVDDLLHTKKTLYVSMCCSCTPLSRLKFSAMFLCYFVCEQSADLHAEFYGDVTGEPFCLGANNARGVGRYGELGPVEGYISETVQDRT